MVFVATVLISIAFVNPCCLICDVHRERRTDSQHLSLAQLDQIINPLYIPLAALFIKKKDSQFLRF